MATTARKTDLSPLEAIVIEGTLGDEARMSERSTTLTRIQQLTKERQKLYTKSAAHPFLAHANSARIRAIGAEIEQLWDVLRRERATRRVQIERALNVTHEDEDENTRPSTGPSDAVPRHEANDTNSTDAA
ncbi:MAG: DUF2630 family protein [Ktedonobacterales bacterium]|nr:DUF2630 family protein [Ktedonobacterales bacterium]